MVPIINAYYSGMPCWSVSPAQCVAAIFSRCSSKVANQINEAPKWDCA
jgi:hypothetical protein